MKSTSRLFLTLALMLVVLPGQTLAQGKQQDLVDSARRTIGNFAIDPEMRWLRSYARRAQAILIVPTMVKAGFIFGGSGGNGVMLARSPRTGRWSHPAFYSMGSVTFGLQIGGEVAEVVLVIMTRRGLHAMLSTDAKLGGDISVAIGPIGAGAKAQTADVIAFSRAKGLYGGINVEGAVIGVQHRWNRRYYGRSVSPADILIRHRARARGSNSLRNAVARLARRRR